MTWLDRLNEALDTELDHGDVAWAVFAGVCGSVVCYGLLVVILVAFG